MRYALPSLTVIDLNSLTSTSFTSVSPFLTLIFAVRLAASPSAQVNANPNATFSLNQSFAEINSTVPVAAGIVAVASSEMCIRDSVRIYRLRNSFYIRFRLRL